jgi:hypothetical protein
MNTLKALWWRNKLARTESRHPVFDDAARAVGLHATVDVRRLFPATEGWPH